jgi:hypothetical protein
MAVRVTDDACKPCMASPVPPSPANPVVDEERERPSAVSDLYQRVEQGVRHQAQDQATFAFGGSFDIRIFAVPGTG